MERRGVYRKGSAGHVRNVGAYRLARQNFKKWRVPVTALLALVLVFGTAPMVGEDSQTSLLTVEQTQRFSQAEPEALRKALLGALRTFTDDCHRFLMDECVNEGNRLVSQVAGAGKADVTKYVAAAENFASQYEETVALKACKFDLGNVFAQSKSAQNTLKEFLEKYGDVLDPAEYSAAEGLLNAAPGALQKLVNSCENKLAK